MILQDTARGARPARRFSSLGLISMSITLGIVTCPANLMAGQLVWQPVGFTTPAQETPQAFFTAPAPLTCSDGGHALPDGGYLAPATSINIDAAAANGGVCQFWYSGTYYPQFDETRWLDDVYMNVYPPTSSSWGHPFWASNYTHPVQTYDSRTTVYGGSTMSVVFPTDSGTTQLAFQTGSEPSTCYTPYLSNILWQSVNVLACAPQFMYFMGPIDHVGPGIMDVFLDPATMSDASTALGLAITSWNAQTSLTGVTFNQVSTACVSGPDCITVESTNTTMGYCGYSTRDAPNPSTGVDTGNMVLQIWDTWDTPGAPWSQVSLERTFVHELGHFLGANDYTAACGTDAAVMQPNFVCGPTATPSATVTVNDYLPIGKTVYNGGTGVSCGF
jgi:hypothetical protein